MTTTTETISTDHRKLLCEIAPANGGRFWIKLIRDEGAHIPANREEEVAGAQLSRKLYRGGWVLVSSKFLAGSKG